MKHEGEDIRNITADFHYFYVLFCVLTFNLQRAVLEDLQGNVRLLDFPFINLIDISTCLQ